MTQFKPKRRQILQAIPAMALLPYSGLTKAALETASTKKPNIIFIMADDLG